MLYSMVHDAMETDSLPTDKRSSSHKHPRALHGNYTNYYAKRSDPPHVLDPRLSLIPARYWVGKAVLDLGCNSGRVTLQVGQLLGAKSVKGLDIDSVLIARAQKSVKLAWSLQRPSAPSVPNYFPLSMPRMFGHLPFPPSSSRTLNGKEKGKGRARFEQEEEGVGFPWNVQFEAQDWMSDLDDVRQTYDIILALSITKWIHLHHLTAGLLSFFRKTHTCLTPGGILILEPQPFATYGKAARFSDLLRGNWTTLKDEGWEDEQMLEGMLLRDVGFVRREERGVTGEGAFRRPVYVYFKSES